jgi:hypothetical protein
LGIHAGSVDQFQTRSVAADAIAHDVVGEAEGGGGEDALGGPIELVPFLADQAFAGIVKVAIGQSVIFENALETD